MAQTHYTSTNTFTKGLIMDLHPLSTSKDCLTNALNATLLTFNGNEMQLQQDMGNGRVETAFLPEGYVPIGTCEFGDIIYVVSYNPLENKSQIGCFPSPERNITSDEVTNIEQNLVAEDFQSVNESGDPTGELKTTSVKKIIYGNKNMNPGDKYIIYEEDSQSDEGSVLEANKNNLSDYANTNHTHDTWPKFVKIKVVSIEDSGKIVDLNASVKWYDNDYYLAQLSDDSSSGTPDIDSYRSLVSSAYSVFQSKVSGKLAILAELEAITAFSCTYDVFTKIKDTTETTEDKPKGTETLYKIYFYTTWESTHNDINPTGFIFTKSAWTTESNGGKYQYPKYTDGTIKYVYTDDQHSLPIKSAESKDGGWDASQVIPYTLTYELGTSIDTYEHYIEKKSYNAFIENIIDWYKSGEEYKAISLTSEYTHEDLRVVTKVNRILDYETGEPFVDKHNNYQYVYNLDSYEYVTTNEGGEYEYKTKIKDGSLLKLNTITLNDDVVNNYFHKDTPSLITDRDNPFSILTSTLVKISDNESTLLDNDLTKLVWNYEVAPAMPYGVLDFLAISGNIDFSKIGSGLIDLTTWRYYNSGDVSTLTWGLDAYTEPNKGIAEVVFDFYDNQGKAASYHIIGKTSYAGTFTEQIVLNQRNSSYKLDNVDAYGCIYYHAGELDDSENETDDTIYLTEGNKPIKKKDLDTDTKLWPNNDSPNKYIDDSGTLYPNLLYLVRITVKYCSKDIIGEYNTDNTSDFKTFYRWFWSNGLFNESYYNVQDFDVLQPRLSLDFSATFDTRGTNDTNQLIPTQLEYYRGSIEGSTTDDLLASSIGAYVYAINQDGNDDEKGNIRMLLEPGLSEGFNTFYLNEASLEYLKDVCIRLGHSSITKSIDSPSLIHTEETHITDLDDVIQPVGDFNEYLECSHEDNTNWDRTGYAAYNYGVYNSVVSNSFLTMLNASRTQYTSEADPVSRAQTGSETEEIYSDSKAYDAYRDSFCLNIVGAELKEKDESNEFSYYDSNGNEISDLEHWQERNRTLEEVRSEGIALTLTGITFNKLFATETALDSDAKVAVPVIYNLEGDNSPETVGLHYYQSHLYFNEVIMWWMGESGGHKTRVGTSYSRNIDGSSFLNNTSAVTGEDDSYNDTKNEWRPSLNDEEPQMLLKSVLSEPISAFMIGRSSAKNGDIKAVNSDVTWKNVLYNFGFSSYSSSDKYIYKTKANAPAENPEDWKGSSDDCWLVHSFAVYDTEQNLVVPFADYFLGYSSNGGNYHQYARNLDSASYQTLADMLGSIFCQLYVIDPLRTAENYIASNFAYTQEYTEYWNTDIVVEMKTDGLDSDAIRRLLTIQTQSLATYLNCLSQNAITDNNLQEPNINVSEDVSSNNVTIELYGVKRTIAFQYAVPYSLGNLLYNYSRMSETKNIVYLSPLKDGNPQVESFTGNIVENTLYTWTGSSLAPFGATSVIYYAKNFTEIDNKIYIDTLSSDAINSSGLGNLSQVLKYDNYKISWHDLSQFSGWQSHYNIQYDGTGDDPYLKNLPLISIFKKFNPSV